jgi:hypothetical protein
MDSFRVYQNFAPYDMGSITNYVNNMSESDFPVSLSYSGERPDSDEGWVSGWQFGGSFDCIQDKRELIEKILKCQTIRYLEDIEVWAFES